MKYLSIVKNRLFSEITTVPEIFRENYYPSLDGLRGISILIVLLGHFGINRLLKPTHLYVDSKIGVHLFFVLSGFLITSILLKEKAKYGRISLKNFYIRRILRIVPVAYLYLLVLICLTIIYHLPVSPFDFITSLLFVKNLPIRNEPYTAHLWTLAAEEQFYLVFPFLLTFSTGKYVKAALVILMIIPVVAVLYINSGIFNSNTVLHLFAQVLTYTFWKGPVIILIGSVFAILGFKGIINVENQEKSYFFSFILFVAAIIFDTKYFIFYHPVVSETLSAIGMAYVILLSLGSNNLLSKILNNKILVKIGVLSYSLYMWQELFIGTRPWQPWLWALNNCPLYMLIIIKLAIVFTIAYVTYYCFERKFLLLKKRFR